MFQDDLMQPGQPGGMPPAGGGVGGPLGGGEPMGGGVPPQPATPSTPPVEPTVPPPGLGEIGGENTGVPPMESPVGGPTSTGEEPQGGQGGGIGGPSVPPTA